MSEGSQGNFDLPLATATRRGMSLEATLSEGSWGELILPPLAIATRRGALTVTTMSAGLRGNLMDLLLQSATATLRAQ